MNIFEFQCQCGKCDDVFPSADLVKILHNVEMHFGKDIAISSGYRCANHNKTVGGSNGSRHIQGQAVDCYVPGIPYDQLYDYLCLTYPTEYGIGLYNTHVHVDSRMNGPARWDNRG